MSSNPLTVGVLIGIVVGFPAGVLYAVARRSWTDFTGAKKAIPAARKAAWNRIREALILGALLTIVAAVGIGLARGR